MTDKELFKFLEPEILHDASLYTMWKMYQRSEMGQEEFLRKAVKVLANDKVALQDSIILKANMNPAPPMVLLRDTESYRRLSRGQKRLLRFFAALGIGKKEAL